MDEQIKQILSDFQNNYESGDRDYALTLYNLYRELITAADVRAWEKETGLVSSWIYY